MCAITKKLVIYSVVLCHLLSVVMCQDNTNVTDSDDDSNVTDARTFGHHFLKRISFAIIPAAFVIGVITTLLAALTVVSIKGLGVGVILLVIAFGQILARALPSAAAPYSAPLPVVYQRQTNDPVWLEKTWR